MSKAPTTRIWAAGCAAATVAVIAGGWFVGIQPQLAHADEADAATATTDAQVQTTQAKIAALSKVAAKQGELEARAAVLDKAVPSALQDNTLTRRLNALAAIDGVAIQSIAKGTATAYTAPTSTGGSATPAAAAQPAATPAPGATPSAAAASPAAAAGPVLAKTDPLISAQNLAVVPVTVVVKGTADAGMQFVKDVQGDERLLLVSGFSTAVDDENAGSVTTTVNGYVYVLKD